MKNDDMQKLNQCLEILDSTDLGFSLVWLWVWSSVVDKLEDGDFDQLVSREEAWDLLVKAVDSGIGFSLTYGADELDEHITDWMIEAGLITDLDEDYLEEDEEEQDNGDN